MAKKLSFLICVLVVGITLSMTVENVVADSHPEGLIAEYTFDDGTWNILTDSSGNDYYGTINNENWVTGLTDYALEFDGVNCFVQMPTNEGLSGLTELTLSAWINYNEPWNASQGRYIPIVSKGSIFNSGFGMFVYEDSVDQSTKLQFLSRGTDSLQIDVSSVNVDPDWAVGEWVFVSAVFDNSEMQLYIDGVMQNVSTANYPLCTTPGGLLIARGVGYESGADAYFNGSMDEVRVFNRALSNEEMKSLFDNITPPIVPSAPQNLQAASGTEKVMLAWAAPRSDGGTNITNYQIYRGLTSGGETFLKSVGNVLNIEDTNVTPNITYYYKIRAKNIIGEGPESNEGNATPIGFPSAPQNLQAIQGKGFVNLSWQRPALDNGSRITSYSVYRGLDSVNVTYFATVTNSLSYNDTDVKEGETYYYRVSANNSAGEGSQSNMIITAPIKAETPGFGLWTMMIATVLAVAMMTISRRRKGR